MDPSVIKVIPAGTARMYQVLPLSRSDKTLTLAMADPTNVLAIDDIRFMTGFKVEPVVAGESALEDAIDRRYGSQRSHDLLRDRAGGGQGPPGTAEASGQDASGGKALSIDDLASLGGLADIDLSSMAEGADIGTATATDDEIDLGNLARSADASPVLKLTNVHARGRV